MSASPFITSINLSYLTSARIYPIGFLLRIPVHILILDTLTPGDVTSALFLPFGRPFLRPYSFLFTSVPFQFLADAFSSSLLALKFLTLNASYQLAIDARCHIFALPLPPQCFQLCHIISLLISAHVFLLLFTLCLVHFLIGLFIRSFWFNKVVFCCIVC